MFDQNQLPVSSGLFLSGLVYAGTCLFITGPLIATRTIENTPWQSACEAGVKAEIDATRTPPKVIPKTDCRSLVGGLFPQLTGLCAKYGNPDFGGPATEVLRAQERARQALEEKRLALIADSSTSRCDCATQIVVQDKAWAIYAGGLRLYTPPPLRDLHARLTSALYSPTCTHQRNLP